MDKQESGQRASNSGPARRSGGEFVPPVTFGPSAKSSLGAVPSEPAAERSKAPVRNKRTKIMKELLVEDPTGSWDANDENGPAVNVPSTPIVEGRGATENSLQPTTEPPANPQSVTAAKLGADLVASGVGYNVMELGCMMASLTALQHSWLVRTQVSLGLVEMTMSHARMHWELAGQHMADIGAMARSSMARCSMAQSAIAGRWLAFYCDR